MAGAVIPDHLSPNPLDSVLSEEEHAAADAMMIRVSRSRSPRLVLDL
jgi:hypothetical protein